MNEPKFRYYIINKPYNMVSQFISSHSVGLLGDLDFKFPEGIHAVGRLDNHSEGLLILTTNKKITRLLFLGDSPHKRTYLVQVNNILSAQSLHLLQTGVNIRIKEGKNYTTPPCEVSIVDNPEKIYPFAINPLAHGPHTWLMITLTEGKFHQVRKMVAAVQHKCVRLIRLSIEDIDVSELGPGQIKEVSGSYFYEKLKL